MIRIVRPSKRYKASYLEALAEYEAISTSPKSVREEIESIDLVIDRQASGAASFRAYWLIDSGRYIGTLQLRPAPSRSQLYYDVRPSARGQGFGACLIRLARKIAHVSRALPLLLTVDADNLASVQTIEKCGGIDITDDAASSVRSYILE